MKTTALLPALLLLAACASPTAVIDKRNFNCGEDGHEVGIAAGFEDPRRTEHLGEPAFLVEVGNNSHDEITVDKVWVQPSNKNQTRIDTAVETEDVVIAEGEAHLYRMPARSPLYAEPEIDPTKIRYRRDLLEFSVTVSLTNGDDYRCGFVVQLED
ncbi:MAG TPA: hypothetical protein VNI54_02055 [Thermoanaerobaculia bacterium]|nr:hypothetical protein [Thermoanaerobaculia bacterium]